MIAKYLTGNCHYDRKLEEFIREAGFHIERIEHPRTRFKPLVYNYQGVAIPSFAWIPLMSAKASEGIIPLFIFNMPLEVGPRGGKHGGNLHRQTSLVDVRRYP